MRREDLFKTNDDMTLDKPKVTFDQTMLIDMDGVSYESLNIYVNKLSMLLDKLFDDSSDIIIYKCGPKDEEYYEVTEEFNDGNIKFDRNDEVMVQFGVSGKVIYDKMLKFLDFIFIKGKKIMNLNVFGLTVCDGKAHPYYEFVQYFDVSYTYISGDDYKKHRTPEKVDLLKCPQSLKHNINELRYKICKRDDE